jgi:hypothetical protein
MTIIKKALVVDMPWVNGVYHQIDFLPSDYENEYIAIAAINNTNCGVGRLITVDKNSYELGGMYVAKTHRG